MCDPLIFCNNFCLVFYCVIYSLEVIDASDICHRPTHAQHRNADMSYF